MTEFKQQTIIRSLKLGIKNKFKSIDEQTENLIIILQSRVSMFRDQLNEVLSNNDENFRALHKNLHSDLEKYEEKLFFIQAYLENARQDEVDEENGVDKLEEKQIQLPNSEQVSLQSFPSQTFCKTLQSRTSLISSTSYCSLQDDYSVSQSHLYERWNCSKTPSENKYEDENVYFHQGNFLENTDPKLLQYSGEVNPESFPSSHSSCYQSISSDINANKVSKAFINLRHSGHQETFKSERHDNFQHCSAQIYKQIRPNALILPASISVPSVITATLSHKISPDDFWLQLEDSKELFSFPTVEFDKETPLFCVQPGYFCLALSNKVNIYYRAKILSETSDDGMVEVFFVDLGSIQRVSVQNLRILPEKAYQIPMRAIHCCLCDILPVSESWSSASIEKFKEYEGSCKVHVESFSCDKYGVQLMIRILDYDLNISEVLCEDGFATFKEMSANNQIHPTYFLPAESSNQMSHDSGVSVTCNQRSSPCNQRLCISSEMLKNNSSGISPEPLQRKNYPPFDQIEMDALNFPTYDTRDLISFESTDQMDYAIKSEPSSYGCSRTADCGCALHLVVPPPFMPFVEEGMMLVMISNVISPSEFYVNAATEDSCNLDELGEQMTAFYESSQNHYVDIENLEEGMFCAGRFDQDQIWYRVKILRIDKNSESRSDVYVQYIDYGNKASLKSSDLRLLKLQFSQHPSFAMKCSLAGIVPRVPEDNEEYSSWNEDAVKTFKQLASFERCLTAQIVKNSITYPLSEGEAVPVLLWDTVGAEDLLINEALVAMRVAEFDSDLVRNVQDQNGGQGKEMAILNHWDPMEADFVDIENSYGVDTDEIAVALSGYKQQDDSRICKYFALRGSCPHGNNCNLEHVPLAEGGVTRDQEETYSLDPTPSLPAPSSHVFIQVSAVISPGQFYSILPFGSKTVDEVDSLVRQGSDPNSWVKTEVRLLFQELSRHYSSSPFSENTTISLSYGSIVVAWRSVDSAWHRGRIIDISGIAGPAKVFFVDFGDDSWVPRKMIREILPQFLHTPFQAVECHLSDIEPLGFERQRSWSPHAINYFKELVSEAVLLAQITDRCGKILHLTMRKTGEKDHNHISASLVNAGFAQYCSYNTSKRKESIYVPG